MQVSMSSTLVYPTLIFVPFWTKIQRLFWIILYCYGYFIEINFLGIMCVYICPFLDSYAYDFRYVLFIGEVSYYKFMWVYALCFGD